MGHMGYSRKPSAGQLEENTAQKVNIYIICIYVIIHVTYIHIFTYIWNNHEKKNIQMRRYIYLHIYGTTMKRKTYKCEDPYHCSAMRSSPETCGTFQVKWRTTTMAAWQLRGRHFPSGGIFSSMVQFLLPSFTSSCGGRRKKKHLLHQKPEIVQFDS